MTTRCHSVFSRRSPVFLSRQLSDVATLRLAIGRPSWVRRISGSLPRFPTRITLLTLPAIALRSCCSTPPARPARGLTLVLCPRPARTFGLIHNAASGPPHCSLFVLARRPRNRKGSRRRTTAKFNDALSVLDRGVDAIADDVEPARV